MTLWAELNKVRLKERWTLGNLSTYSKISLNALRKLSRGQETADGVKAKAILFLMSHGVHIGVDSTSTPPEAQKAAS